MDDYRFDEDVLLFRAQNLGHRSRVAFGLLCCERLFPNYLAFQNDSRWGRPDVVRDALDATWDWLASSSGETASIERLQAAVEAAQPNTEDFDSLFVSAALDAATATEALLQLVLHNREEDFVEIASFSRDTVDMYVQEVDQMDSTDANLEERIRSHALMQRELRQQHTDLEMLEHAEIGPDFVRSLRQERRQPAISNIDLPNPARL